MCYHKSLTVKYEQLAEYYAAAYALLSTFYFLLSAPLIPLIKVPDF